MGKKIIEIKIEGVINCDISRNKFIHEFIEWLESKGWSFGGNISDID